MSTTDVEGVVALARRLRVDGVIAYASDPAALTAAAVADCLGLPGDPLDAVRRSQDKLLLRAAQMRAGLPVPEFANATDAKALGELEERSPLGIVVKPCDSSGSKGVSLLSRGEGAVRLTRALEAAHSASRSSRIIAEAVWGASAAQLNGDMLVIEGRIVFLSLGDSHLVGTPGSRMPIGTLYPSLAPDGLLREAERQAHVLVAALGLRNGVYNLEVRLDERGVPTIIDFGARVGGNLSSIVHWVSTGVDLVTANIEMALGRTPVVTCGPNRLAGNFALHSSRSGRLRSLELSHKLRSAAHTISMALAEGDSVRPYRTSADSIGSVVITGDDRASLEDLYADPTSHVRLTLDEEDR